ncbi:hypothetical protein JCM8097_003916 [Rhodosporidiobolus ruineniae]
MLLKFSLAAVLTALAAREAEAQSCPTGLSLVGVNTAARDGSKAYSTQCCTGLAFDFPAVAYSGCDFTVYSNRTDPADWHTMPRLACGSRTTTTLTLKAGTRVARVETQLMGGNGASRGSYAGGKAYFGGFASTTLPILNKKLDADFKLSYLINMGGGGAAGSATAGGGWTALADAACVAKNGQGPYSDGFDCRYAVAGGGGGAGLNGPGGDAGKPGTPNTQGVAAQPGSQQTSSGQGAFYFATTGWSGAAGGGGIRGGGSVFPLPGETTVNSGSGAGGSSGAVAHFEAIPERVYGYVDVLPGMVVDTYLPDVQCFDPYSIPAKVTTYSATSTVSETSYTQTVYTPTATNYETETSTVTNTPATATVVELETSIVTLTAATSTETFDGGLTTPPVITVSTSTDVTTTPATSTVTSVVVPATSTVLETSWATSTPPTKTITSVQTVQTGHADCTNYRLVFPADCCPNQYVKLKSLHRRSLNLEKRAGSAWYVDGGVLTTTTTVSAVQTLPTDATTVTSTQTETTEAATPLATSTETDTITLDQETVTVSTTTYGEAPTPTSTLTSTVFHEAATPLATSFSTVAAPLTTSSVASTTTLAQPVTTTTSTAYAQATTCAVKTVYTQASCPSSNLVKTLVQDAQVATLNLYKVLGGKSVIVDCGSAGTFSY